MRRRQHTGGPTNSGGRRPPHSGHKFPRPQGDDGASGNRARGNNRNAGAAREKFMNMGRDALHAGDRVLGEYYFQHADHYFRVMMEEGPRPQQSSHYSAPIDQRGGQNAQGGDSNGNGSSGGNGSHAGEYADEREQQSSSSSALPSFITTPVTSGAPAQRDGESDRD